MALGMAVVHLPWCKLASTLIPETFQQLQEDKLLTTNLFIKIWLTEAYYDKHLALLDHLYDLDAATKRSGYIRGRFWLDIL